MIKNWSVLSFSNIVQQIIGFFVLVRITRFLDTGAFGVYVVVFTIIGVGQVFALLGLRQIVIREIARDEKYLINNWLKIVVILFCSHIITAAVTTYYLIYFENISELILIIQTIVLLFLATSWNYFETLSFGKQDMQFPAYTGIVGSLLLIIILYIIPSRLIIITTVLNIYILSQFLRTLILFYLQVRTNYYSFDNLFNNFSSMKQLLLKSMPIYGTALLTIPITQLPILFLNFFSGKEEVAYFGLGFRLTMPLTIVSQTLINSIYPVLSKEFVSDKDKFSLTTRNYFILIILFGTIISVGISLFSKEIFIVLFGAKYENSAIPFIFQIFYSIIFTILVYNGALLSSTNNEKLVFTLAVINSVLIGIGNFWGAHYGAVGLSLSLFVGATVCLAINWVIIEKTKLIDISIFQILIILIGYIIIIFSVLGVLQLAWYLKFVIYLLFVPIQIYVINKIMKYKLIDIYKTFFIKHDWDKASKC